MNQETIESQISQNNELTQKEKDLMKEENFLKSILKILKQSRTNISQACKDLKDLLRILSNKYRKYCKIGPVKGKSERLVFFRLLQTKRKDNFLSFDRNLKKLELRYKMRKTRSKFLLEISEDQFQETIKRLIRKPLKMNMIRNAFSFFENGKFTKKVFRNFEDELAKKVKKSRGNANTAI